jgi:hypothetical protein
MPPHGGGRISTERIVQPFANFMRSNRNIYDPGTEVSRGVVIGWGVGLQIAECAVIPQDAAVEPVARVEHRVAHQEDHEGGRVAMNRVENGRGEIMVKEIKIETAQQAAAAASKDRAMEGGRGRAYRLCGRNGDIVERAVRARGAADCLQEFGPAMRVIVSPRAHVNAIDFCRASGAYAPIKSHGGNDRRAPEVLKVRVSHRPAAEIWSGRIEHLAANVNDHRNQEYFDVRRGVSCRKCSAPRSLRCIVDHPCWP